MSISVDDIAALATVADRQASFSNRLKTTFIDIRWILDRDADGTPAPKRILGEDTTLSSPHTTMRKAQGSDGSHRREHSTAVEPPGGVWRTLTDVDLSICAEMHRNDEVLINSPRSALVILRNGFGLSDILGVPEQQIRNQALLDGAGVEATDMRLAADQKRRELRRAMLTHEYSELCLRAQRADVIEAMREHHFAMLRESRANLERTRTLSPLVPLPAHDALLFDPECLDRINASRDKAAKELTRHLAQMERQRRHLLEAEERILIAQRENAGLVASSNVHRDRIIAAKKAALRAKSAEALEKSNMIIDAVRRTEEKRRSEILLKRHETEHRALEGRQLQRVATKMNFARLGERRFKVREAEKALLEHRRDELEAKTRLKESLLRRTLETKERELQRHKQELEEAAEKRREHLRAAAEAEQRRRAEQSTQLLAVSDARAKQIMEERQARREAKQRRAQEKVEKLRRTRATREDQARARLAALDQAHEDKMKQLDEADAERRRHIEVQNERMSLVRQERAEEQARSQSIEEFKYVRYVSGSMQKASALERESQRRAKLWLIVRQERESIARARDEMRHELLQRENMERRRLERSYL